MKSRKKSAKSDNPFLTQLPETEIWNTYTGSELKEDLNFMVKTMEEVHPDLYFSIPGKDAESLVEAIKEKLTDGLSRTEFYSLLAPLVARFNDGHTRVAIPHEEYIKSDEKGPVRFPFHVKCSTEGIQLTESVLEDYKHLEGSRVSAINGEDAGKLVTAMESMISGESMEFRRSALSNNFPKLHYAFKGGSDNYILDITGEDKTETVTVPAASREQTKSIAGTNSDNDTEAYTYEIFKDAGYCLLNLTRCEDQTKFKIFIREMFTKLAGMEVKNLIVDLRKNGGGDSSLADEFCA